MQNKLKSHFPIQKCLAGTKIQSLSDIELLAIIIGSALPGSNVINLATEIYHKYHGLPGLTRCGIRELTKVPGIGLIKSIKILAALEMGKRSLNINTLKIEINTPGKVWHLLLPDIIGLKKEIFYLLVLNQKNFLLKKSIVSIGTVSETLVHPREIFNEAIRESGSSIIIAHNHPSGVNIPSNEDLKITRRIKKAGAIIGIQLLDHIIICEKTYFSFKDNGHL